MSKVPNKTYITVLRKDLFGNVRYYGTYADQAAMLKHFSERPDVLSTEISQSSDEFLDLTVHTSRTAFRIEKYHFRESEFVGADLSEMEERVLGHIAYSSAPADWAHGQTAVYPNRKRTERYEK